MASTGRDPSRFGYLTRLSYEGHTPAFLVKLQNRVAGVADDDDDDEFEDDGSGRPPIPKRPPIPQRPADQPGSADEDEDEGDEKPQVVVLKEGKHLTAHEAENERRKRKGLPPLQDPAKASTSVKPAAEVSAQKETKSSNQISNKSQKYSLQFSSSKSGFTGKPSTGKRKAVSDPEPAGDQVDDAPKPSRKKSKKPSKALLSFDDGT